MTLLLLRRSLVVAILVFFSVHATHLVSAYFFSDDYPHENVSIMYRFVVYFIAAYLVVIDNRITNTFRESYDFGFLTWIFWPVFVPVYLIKSRGWRGIPLLLVLFVVFFVEQIVYLSWYWAPYLAA